jgi:transcriptional regulator with XRE-family HTH domain
VTDEQSGTARAVPADHAARLRAFGANVRSARMEAGMTQEQLAVGAGLNRTYVIAIEKGRQNLSVHAIWLLADAIGVRPEKFFGDVPGEGSSETAS